MLTILPLLLKFAPWVGMALAGLAALFIHKNAQTTKAQAAATVSDAKTQIAQVQAGEAKADATAAQAGADSLKEKQDVQATVAALPPGAAASELRNNWSK